jgi:hypothetical protein
MSFWESDSSEPGEEVVELPVVRKKRGRPFKNAVAAIVAAVVPRVLKPEPKPASAPANPFAGWSEDMRRAEREMRNDFGEFDDDRRPSFKKRRGESWAAGDGASYTFSTHLPENRYEMGGRSDSPNAMQSDKEKFW